MLPHLINENNEAMCILVWLEFTWLKKTLQMQVSYVIYQKKNVKNYLIYLLWGMRIN